MSYTGISAVVPYYSSKTAGSDATNTSARRYTVAMEIGPGGVIGAALLVGLGVGAAGAVVVPAYDRYAARNSPVSSEAAPAVVTTTTPPVTTTTTPTTPTTTPSLIRRTDIRALYVTASTFGDTTRRTAVIQAARAAQANALVIDVKDGSGVQITSHTADDLAAVHREDLYAIARIVAFQDNEYARQHPADALQTSTGMPWSYRGAYWLDPAAPAVRAHVREVALRAAAMGFDEINIDYVRFPSDGDLHTIRYPYYDEAVPRQQVIADALEYVRTGLHEQYPAVPLSADVFAFSFLGDSDVGIGQRLVTIAPHVDVIAPMIYPSHYAPNTFEFTNPADHPYEVAHETLQRGMRLLNQLPSSTRPTVRPWIQAFNLGAVYDTAKIQAQLRAAHDLGLPATWMAWNAGNSYASLAY